MGRILLIIGAIIGGLILAIGLLVVITALAQPDSNQSDEVFGGLLFVGVGLVIAAPCTFFAYRMTRAVTPWAGGSTSLAPAGPSAEQLYLQWFTWCQQAIGGDAITVHSATMAALRAPDDPTGAAQSEASRQAGQTGAAGVMPAPPGAAKVKLLARIGASTLGLLEPSERVLVSFVGRNTSAGTVAFGAAFGAIGVAIAASTSGSVFFTVTDRRVIALIAGTYSGLANKVALIDSRSTVTAKSSKRLFGTRAFSLKGMQGGSVSAGVSRLWQPEAAMAFELIQPSSVSQVGVIR
jgi:hypothetical protein